jgi:hypothetical protein
LRCRFVALALGVSISGDKHLDRSAKQVRTKNPGTR